MSAKARGDTGDAMAVGPSGDIMPTSAVQVGQMVTESGQMLGTQAAAVCRERGPSKGAAARSPPEEWPASGARTIDTLASVIIGGVALGL